MNIEEKIEGILEVMQSDVVDVCLLKPSNARQLGLERPKRVAKVILSILPDQRLYEAVNKLMTKIGAEGKIDTETSEVSDVMSVLYDIDKGVNQ